MPWPLSCLKIEGPGVCRPILSLHRKLLLPESGHMFLKGYYVMKVHCVSVGPAHVYLFVLCSALSFLFFLVLL